MKSEKSSIMETTTLERVPMEDRKSWQSVAFIWAGTAIAVPGLMLGGMAADILPFWPAVAALLLGYSLIVVYMVFLGSQSSDLGVPTTVAISSAFGKRGSGFAISCIIAVAMTGWFAFQTTVCASSMNMLLESVFGIHCPLWLMNVLCGVVMLATAIYGFVVIKILNYISVPALAVMLLYGLYYALTRPGALEHLAGYTPPNPGSFVSGVSMAVGGMAVSGVIAGDYTRYCKSRRDTSIAAVMGVIPGGVGILVIGAILAITTGNYDITLIFTSIGVPFLGLLVLVLATWTTNTGNAYSAGIALVNMFQLKDDRRAAMTMAAGLVGTALAAVGIINYFGNFLNLISACVPPVVGAAVADYWILGKGRPENWKPVDGVNWIGCVSWALGAGAALLFPNFFIPAINGIAVSLVCYLIGSKIAGKKAEEV